MLNGVKALINSEKALVGGFLSLISATFVLTAHMTVDQWISFNEVLFVGYIGGKTLQGAASAFAAKKTDGAAS